MSSSRMYAGGVVAKRSKAINDRRIQKTHNLVRRALGSLIAEKPYDSIVVKEILDRAVLAGQLFICIFKIRMTCSSAAYMKC